MPTETLSQRALERRLKRHLLKETQHFLAACAPAFEEVLAKEVAALPEVQAVTRLRGGVAFSGPLDSLYHANLQLRTANRVLLRIDDFLAQSYPMLFDHARKVPWELFLGFSPAYRVRVSARESRLRHHKDIAKTLSDAITRTLEPLGLAPTVNDDAPLEIFVRMFQDRCTLSINSSGEHLHKRGYRQATAKAPLRETLTAGLLLTCGWQQYDLIVDPMCGAGTILIEAALLASKIPPGAARAFAFESFPSFQNSKWQRFKREALSKAVETSPVRLLGFDLHPGGVQAAKANASRAGVAHKLTFAQADARSLPYRELAREKQHPLLICNLPYGRRVGEPREAQALYDAFVTQLLNHCQGWDYALLTTQPQWLQDAGLKVNSSLEFSNGGLQVSFVSGTL